LASAVIRDRLTISPTRPRGYRPSEIGVPASSAPRMPCRLAQGRQRRRALSARCCRHAAHLEVGWILLQHS
jgi:hypothetical protein